VVEQINPKTTGVIVSHQSQCAKLKRRCNAVVDGKYPNEAATRISCRETESDAGYGYNSGCGSVTIDEQYIHPEVYGSFFDIEYRIFLLLF